MQNGGMNGFSMMSPSQSHMNGMQNGAMNGFPMMSPSQSVS